MFALSLLQNTHSSHGLCYGPGDRCKKRWTGNRLIVVTRKGRDNRCLKKLVKWITKKNSSFVWLIQLNKRKDEPVVDAYQVIPNNNNNLNTGKPSKQTWVKTKGASFCYLRISLSSPYCKSDKSWEKKRSFEFEFC